MCYYRIAFCSEQFFPTTAYKSLTFSPDDCPKLDIETLRVMEFYIPKQPSVYEFYTNRTQTLFIFRGSSVRWHYPRLVRYPRRTEDVRHFYICKLGWFANKCPNTTVKSRTITRNLNNTITIKMQLKIV